MRRKHISFRLSIRSDGSASSKLLQQELLGSRGADQARRPLFWAAARPRRRPPSQKAMALGLLSWSFPDMPAAERKKEEDKWRMHKSPLSSNSSTTLECPQRAAKWREQTPPREGRFTSAPWSTNSRTTCWWPWRQARWSGVTPLCKQTFQFIPSTFLANVFIATLLPSRYNIIFGYESSAKITQQ